MTVRFCAVGTHSARLVGLGFDKGNMVARFCAVGTHSARVSCAQNNMGAFAACDSGVSKTRLHVASATFGLRPGQDMVARLRRTRL